MRKCPGTVRFRNHILFIQSWMPKKCHLFHTVRVRRVVVSQSSSSMPIRCTVTAASQIVASTRTPSTLTEYSAPSPPSRTRRPERAPPSLQPADIFRARVRAKLVASAANSGYAPVQLRLFALKLSDTYEAAPPQSIPPTLDPVSSQKGRSTPKFSHLKPTRFYLMSAISQEKHFKLGTV